MSTTSEPQKEILAVPPVRWGELIHLHSPGYKPSQRHRFWDNAALCNSSITYQLRNALTAPLADALKWLQREPTVEDPRPAWRLCRSCLGHAAEIAGLGEALIRQIVINTTKETS
ncbi:MAG: hypothetical protein HOQ21_10045 [Dermatophilaceae bacterium]|nr:hypothetical protein [Dermatophilaceae bacterium]